MHSSLYKGYLVLTKSRAVDWLSKLLISLNLVMIIGTTPDHFYPDLNIVIALVGLWLYFLDFKLISLLPLLIGIYIHLDHYFFLPNYQ